MSAPAVLAWTAGKMMAGDEGVLHWFHLSYGPFVYAVAAGVTILVVSAGYITNKKAEREEGTLI